MKLSIIAILALVVAGCSSIPFYQPGPDKVALLVDEYCKRVSSGGRSAFRAIVNTEAAPHSVYIWCYGNGPPWLPDDRWNEWMQETPEGETWLNSTLNEVTQ